MYYTPTFTAQNEKIAVEVHNAPTGGGYCLVIHSRDGSPLDSIVEAFDDRRYVHRSSAIERAMLLIQL